MDDDDAAPTQFKIEDNEESQEDEKMVNEVPTNLWFVLSPANTTNTNLQIQQRRFYQEHHHPQQRDFNLEFCPLCMSRHRVFYCCDCITKGEFMHSNPRKHGDLAEKRIQYEMIESRRQKLSTKLNDKLKSSTRMRFLQEEIKLTKQRIKYLNHIIKDKSEFISKAQKDTEKLITENKKRTLRLPQFGSKVNKIDQYAKQHGQSLSQQRLKINQKFKSLGLNRREHIKELTRLIFPIELVQVASCESQESTGNDEAFDAIMAEMQDAMSTSFIHGRWVTTSMTDGGATAIQLEGDKQWKIVAPHLPANDSLLYSFVASMETTTSTMISPLHTILGGLTLTAQFLCQIASCLDIINPKRLSLNDFGLHAPSSEAQFVKKLTRLNVNAVHLCLGQGMNPDILKPTEALHNLATLIDYFDKNQSGLLSVPYKLDILHSLSLVIAKEMEDLASQSEEFQLDSDHDEDSFNTEDTWESVVPSDMTIVHPLLNQQQLMMPNSPSPPPTIGSNPYSMSVAGSFMSSWLRGITSPSNSPTSPHK